MIRDTLALLAERGLTPDLENLEPWDDAGIWKMIATGNARGVHHIDHRLITCGGIGADDHDRLGATLVRGVQSHVSREHELAS